MLRPPRAPAHHGICECVAQAAHDWRGGGHCSVSSWPSPVHAKRGRSNPGSPKLTMSRDMLSRSSGGGKFFSFGPPLARLSFVLMLVCLGQSFRFFSSVSLLLACWRMT